MQSRDAVDGEAGERQRFAPIHFVDGTYILRAKQPGDASRNNKCGISASRQPAQGGQIQVVIMIVTDEHGVDAGQMLPGYSRFSKAARTYPGERAGAFGPDRVRQDVGARLLQEHGRVVHQSDAQSAALDTAGRYGLLDIRNETGRRLRAGGELPPEGPKQPWRPGSIGIVEALTVKVLLQSRVDRTLLHESPFPASW